MADLNMPIAEKLERYRVARGINRGTRDWCDLLAGYQRKPEFFDELLDQELARLARIETEVHPQ